MGGLFALWMAAAPPQDPSGPDAATSTTRSSTVRGLEFRWDAPPGCPDEPTVQGRVEAIVDADLGSRASDRTTVVARVREERGTWNLRLWVIAPEGTRLRELDVEQCDLAAEAAVLLTALVFDPTASERVTGDVRDAASRAEDRPAEDPPAMEEGPGPSEPAPAKTVSPPPTTPDVQQPDGEGAPPPRPRTRRRIGGALRVASGVEGGTLPGVGPPIALGASLVVERARLDLEVQHTFARQLALGDGASARFQLTSGVLRGGPRFQPLPRLWLRPTVGLELGGVVGRGEGLDESFSAGVTFFAARLGGELSGQVLPWLALGVAAEGHVALLRPSFTVDGLGTIYSLPAGGFRALAFAEVTWGRGAFGPEAWRKAKRPRTGRKTP
jgi:hypothetical protein